MAKDKVVVVIPDEKKFDPAPIPFGVITGEGVDNYNEDGKEYSVSMVLDKKQAKHLHGQVMDFWEEHKPAGAGKEPANIDGIIRKGKDEYKGTYIVYAKTQTEFNDKPNVIGIVGVDKAGVLQKLDPEEYGFIGAGSEGRLAVTFSVYVQGKKKGVSVFLSGVKLTKYVKYEASGGVSAFGSDDKGEVSDAGDFSKGKKKKKKGKDKSEEEAPKKAKKEKKHGKKNK